jgi:hypothetical protein
MINEFHEPDPGMPTRPSRIHSARKMIAASVLLICGVSGCLHSVSELPSNQITPPDKQAELDRQHAEATYQFQWADGEAAK